MRSVERFLAPVALGIAALLVRAGDARQVLTEAGLQPPSADAYYHLRRIGFSVVRFPENLDWDAYLNYPAGAHVVWPPLFDWSCAAIALLLTGGQSQAAVERVVAWVPPVLGALTVVAVYAVARRFLSPRAAVFSAALLCVLPAHVHFSRIGFVDHHVAVALFSALLLGSAAMLVSAPAKRLGRAGALHGLACAAMLMLWPGAMLHVGAVQLPLVVWLLAAPDRAAAVPRARALAIASATAAVVVAPFGLGSDETAWGRTTLIVLSHLQPLYFGAGAACFAVVAVLWTLAPRSASTRGRRIAAAIATGAVVLGAASAAVPEIWSSTGYAAGWFASHESFHEHVLELRSPLRVNGRWNPQTAAASLGYLFALTPLGLLALAGPEPARTRSARLVLVCWITVLAGAASLQFRFLNSFSIGYVWAIGFALDRALVWIHGRFPNRAVQRSLGIATVLAALLLVAPIAEWLSGEYLDDVPRLLRGQPPDRPYHPRVLETARWLGAHTPPTSGYFDPSATPEYSILGGWSDGHVLRYVARRPMVQDNFGVYGGRENYELAEQYFASRSEEEAVSLLDRVDARYVVVGPTGSGHSTGYAKDSVFQRAYRQRGTASPDADGPAALTRHRLVFESGSRIPIRTFERVAGALVEGAAPPGSRATALLQLRTPSGRLVYRTHARVSESGRYRLRLPYPNESFSPSIHPDDEWRISAGTASARIRIREAEVQSGATRAGPDLRTRPDRLPGSGGAAEPGVD